MEGRTRESETTVKNLDSEDARLKVKEKLNGIFFSLFLSISSAPVLRCGF